ncbi:MAG: recombinase family protein [Clostridia bacterium]|nr:recombinase family protein [Clostridia bacterium]
MDTQLIHMYYCMFGGYVMQIDEDYCFYLRKSRVDIEAEIGGEFDTLKRHEEILDLLARRMKIVPKRIYKEIVSGETIAARPVMQELLTDVENDMWAGVFVVEIERLARGDTLDQGLVAQVFKYSNTEIITPLKTYRPWRDEDEEYFEFSLFMSRREYKKINQRMNAGRLASVREGKYVGSKLPYGYTKEKLKGKGYKLVINEEHATVIRQIFKWRAKEHSSYIAIAKKLNELNVQPLIAEKWSQPMVRQILYDDLYIGKVHWNRRKTVKAMKKGKIVITRPRNKSNDVVVANGLHEPIIDIETWNQVQSMKQIKRIPQTAPKNPMAGLLICGMCGQKLQRKLCKSNKTPSEILICVNTECQNIGASLALVESKLIESLRLYLKNYQIDLSSREKKDNNEIKLMQSSISSSEKELQTFRKKLDAICDLYEDGSYTREIYKERSTSIISKIKTLEGVLESQQSTLKKSQLLKENAESLMPLISNVIDVYYMTEDIEEKNMLLKSVLEKVVYNKYEKASDSVTANFELKIYPKVPS